MMSEHWTIGRPSEGTPWVLIGATADTDAARAAGWELVELIPAAEAEAEWLRLRKIIVEHQEASVREAAQLATTKAALAQSVYNEKYLRTERARLQLELERALSPQSSRGL